MKIRFDKKVFVDKVYELISTKARTYEDRSISTLGYEVATFTYPEYDWGPNNGVPQIVLEFDVTNSYLLTAQITYNRREANNKILAFNSRDLQQRLIDEFNDMKIWDAAGAESAQKMKLNFFKMASISTFTAFADVVSKREGRGWFFERF